MVLLEERVIATVIASYCDIGTLCNILNTSSHRTILAHGDIQVMRINQLGRQIIMLESEADILMAEAQRMRQQARALRHRAWAADRALVLLAEVAMDRNGQAVAQHGM